MILHRSARRQPLRKAAWVFAVGSLCLAGVLLGLGIAYSRWTESRLSREVVISCLQGVQQTLATGFARCSYDRPTAEKCGLPLSDSEEYLTSTEYLRWARDRHRVGYVEDIFVAPWYHLPNAPRQRELNAENNAWCFTLDVADNAPGEIPIAFTRNLSIRRLSDTDEMAVSSMPLLGRRVLVVYRNGAAAILDADQMGKLFNPKGATNRVLRPATEVELWRERT